MATFKTSVQRKYYIDKKIREKAFPTASSLAKGFEAEFGKKIDPRTIASDIAELKEKYKAPIKYNAQKRGYEYIDSDFIFNVLDGDTEIPFDNKKSFSTMTLPDWKKNVLLNFMNKTVPLTNKTITDSNITIIPQRHTNNEQNDIECILIEAINENKSVLLTEKYQKEGFIFVPNHVICEGDLHLYFGSKIESQYASEFVLIPLYNIKSVEKQQDTWTTDTFIDPAIDEDDISYSETIVEKTTSQKNNKKFYVQTSGNNDYEIIMSDGKVDTTFIFACRNPYDKKTEQDYLLVAKMDLFS